MNAIVKILMNRDGLSFPEATKQLLGAREEVYAGANPEEILLEQFGLEPDYIFDILD